MFPTRVTQRIQVIIQNNVIGRVLGEGGQFRPPLLLRLTSRFAILRRLPARLGIGVRPEHVMTPERSPAHRLSQMIDGSGLVSRTSVPVANAAGRDDPGPRT